MKKILVVFFVLLVLGCSHEQESSETSNPPKTPKAVAEISNPLLQCKPQDLISTYRNAYRLAPDRRFLLAISEVRKFFPSQKEQAVGTTFANGNWHITYGEEQLGTIPELADFADFMNVLSSWVRNLNSKSALKLASTKDGEALEAESRHLTLTPTPVKMLMKADELWAKQKDGALLAAAARATTYMAFENYDVLDLADPLESRALALIVLTKLLTHYPMDREESLLAYTMLYARHAEKVALMLPTRDPVRMFLNKTDLSEMATSSSASEEVRFLRLMQLSQQPYTKLWQSSREKFFPPGFQLAIMKSALSVRRLQQMENESFDDLAVEIPHSVIAGLDNLRSGLSGTHVSHETGEIQLEHFEALINDLYKNNRGIFSDADIIASFYDSFFYSALSRWKRRVPLKGTREVSGEFDRYMTLKEMAENANPKVDNFINVARTLKHLGGAAGYPLYTLVNKLSWDSPSIPKLCRVMASIFDARPSDRLSMAWLFTWKLYDRNHAEELYSSLLKTLSAQDTSRIVEPAVYLGQVSFLKEILHSSQCDELCASDILYNWAYTDVIHNKEIEEEYDRQIPKNPHSWLIINVYVDFLRKIKKHQKANTIVQQWLTNNKDPKQVGYFHAHARLAHGYYLTGEYQKSLEALKPIAPSWVVDRESALALSKLGKHDEAEQLSRAAQASASQDFETLLVLVQVLWESGKYQEAATKLQQFYYPNVDWCRLVGTSFYTAFQKASSTEVHRAIDALRAAHLTGWRLTCLPLDFAKEHEYEIAFEIQSYIMPPGSADENIAIDSYIYLKKWKGEKEAIQWIKKMIPPSKLNPLSFKALYNGEYNVLWDVIQNPYYKNQPHFVWLFRAAASVKQGTKNDPHYQVVYKYFNQPIPDPYFVMGRFLLGLSTEADMLKVAADPSRRSDIAYYFGLKAESEGRIKDASEWYRISMDTGSRDSFGAVLSRTIVSNWPILGFWAINLPKPDTAVAEKL
jgi:hypothetical protein